MKRLRNMRRPKPSRADYLTVLNAAFGIVAIWYYAEHQYMWGNTMLLFAMIFDGLDGYVARRWGSSRGGAYLDSMADAISFALAPAIAVYTSFYDPSQASSLTLESPLNTLTVVASLTFALAGILRLARFTKKHRGLPHFKGVATPLAAGFILFLTYLFGRDSYPGYFGFGQHPLPVLMAVMLIAFLMLVPVSFPKVRGKIVIPFAATLILMGAVPPLAYLLASPVNFHLFVLLSRISASVALFIFVLYLTVCPVLLRGGVL